MLDNQAVDHGLNRVGLVAVEFDVFVDGLDAPVHPHPYESGPPNLLEDRLMRALAAPDDGSQDQDARAGRKFLDCLDDLLGRLLANLAGADRAVGDTGAGKEQPQMVIGLGDRPHG